MSLVNNLYRFFYSEDYRKNKYKNTIKARLFYLKKFLPSIRNIALDLGCGNYSTLELFSNVGFKKIIGVDQLINIENNKNNKIDFVKSDILEYLKDCNDNSFDMVSIFDVVEHISLSSIDILFENIYRVLKPNGSLVIQSPNGSSPLFGSIFYGDPTHIFCFNEYSLTNLLISSGFKKEKINLTECHPVPQTFFSFFRFIFWFLVRYFYKIVYLVETGTSPKVLSRVFIIGAYK
tara:strand:- start:269 stop:970 length:702 start_codon:yes stop_codon:yes gene_type:complete